LNLLAFSILNLLALPTKCQQVHAENGALTKRLVNCEEWFIVNETKTEKPSVGSTTKVMASKRSLPNMKDGEESDAMLLALLWSPVPTLVNRKKALLATGNYNGQPATIVILVGTELTDKGITLKTSVGSANKDGEDET